MSGSGKDVSGMVGISWDEVGAGTFPDRYEDHDDEVEELSSSQENHAQPPVT